MTIRFKSFQDNLNIESILARGWKFFYDKYIRFPLTFTE